MRATAFVIVLLLALLSTAVLAQEVTAQAARGDAARSILMKGSLSEGPKSEVPGLMSYQGTLTDDAGIALDTTVSVTFTIYNADVGGSVLWTETQPLVDVNDGLFNVLLGEVNALTAGVFSGADRWLGVQVNSDPELDPRQRIGAVAYAFQSGGDGDWLIVGDDLYSNVADQVNIISTAKALKGTTGRQSSRTEESGITKEKGSNALYVYGENKVVLEGYLYADDAAADDRSAVRGFYDPGAYNAGSGYGYNQTNNGVIGLNAYGDPYTFGVAGYSDNGSPRSGGVIGATASASYWGSLGYNDEYGSDWGIYTPNNAHFGGNVGIGTASPAYRLDVAGDVNINSVYRIGGAQVLSTTGTQNTFAGAGAGLNNTSSYGTFVGYNAGYNNQGQHNTFLGRWAGYSNTTGQRNTFVASNAGRENTTGSNNVFIGYEAGRLCSTGVSNVFLGYRAGYYESGSNKLYIDISETSSPLIYGEFNNDILAINGDVGIGTTAPTARLEALNSGDNVGKLGTSEHGVYGESWDAVDLGGYFENRSTGVGGPGAYDNATALRAFSGTGTLDDIHPSPTLNYLYPAAAEFSGPNGVIGAASPDGYDGAGVVGVADGASQIPIYAAGFGDCNRVLYARNWNYNNESWLAQHMELMLGLTPAMVSWARLLTAISWESMGRIMTATTSVNSAPATRAYTELLARVMQAISAGL